MANSFQGSIARDSNRQPHLTLDSYNICTFPSDLSNAALYASVAFAGGTTNARGDDGGTNDPYTLFNVTGDVAIRMFGVCTTDLVSAGGGTLEIGVTGNTAAILAQETATDIDANGIYVSATQVKGVLPLATVVGPFIVVNGLDILETIGTADVTGGNMYYVCLWRPLSPTSTVIPAL